MTKTMRTTTTTIPLGRLLLAQVQQGLSPLLDRFVSERLTEQRDQAHDWRETLRWLTDPEMPLRDELDELVRAEPVPYAHLWTLAVQLQYRSVGLSWPPPGEHRREVVETQAWSALLTRIFQSFEAHHLEYVSLTSSQWRARLDQHLLDAWEAIIPWHELVPLAERALEDDAGNQADDERGGCDDADDDKGRGDDNGRAGTSSVTARLGDLHLGRRRHRSPPPSLRRSRSSSSSSSSSSSRRSSSRRSSSHRVRPAPIDTSTQEVATDERVRHRRRSRRASSSPPPHRSSVSPPTSRSALLGPKGGPSGPAATTAAATLVSDERGATQAQSARPSALTWDRLEQHARGDGKSSAPAAKSSRFGASVISGGTGGGGEKIRSAANDARAASHAKPWKHLSRKVAWSDAGSQRSDLPDDVSLPDSHYTALTTCSRAAPNRPSVLSLPRSTGRLTKH